MGNGGRVWFEERYYIYLMSLTDIYIYASLALDYCPINLEQARMLNSRTGQLLWIVARCVIDDYELMLQRQSVRLESLQGGFRIRYR